MTKISRQLDEDSVIDLGEKVAIAVALAFTYAEDNAGFNGDGTSQYGGIVGVLGRLAQTANSYSVITAATGDTGPSTLTTKDYLKVIGAYPAYPNADPVWICHKSFWAQSHRISLCW